MQTYNFQGSALYEALLASRSIKFDKDQVVLSTEYREALMLIKTGYVKRYSITNTGTESIQTIYGPGEVFTITWALKVLLGESSYRGREVFYYAGMTDCELHVLREPELVQIAETNPNIYKDLFHISGIRFRATIHSLENMSLSNIEKRLAHQLFYYAKYYGTQQTNGTKIAISFTHKDLASLLNATRESVSVNIKALRDKGLIKTQGGICVPDMERLEEFAYE